MAAVPQLRSSPRRHGSTPLPVAEVPAVAPAADRRRTGWFRTDGRIPPGVNTIGGRLLSMSWVTLVPRSTRFINVTVCSSQRSAGPSTPLVWKSASVPAEATTSPAALSRAIPFSSPGLTRSCSADSRRSLERTAEPALRPKHDAERGGDVLGAVDQLRPRGACARGNARPSASQDQHPRGQQ